jgi:hypothetical protein
MLITWPSLAFLNDPSLLTIILASMQLARCSLLNTTQCNSFLTLFEGFSLNRPSGLSLARVVYTSSKLCKLSYYCRFDAIVV